MNDFHGIICAYVAAPELGDLVSHRTSASLPIGGRYRLIDFILSSMVNAGVHDVGVVMQRDYQSLIDHVGSGKEWDLSRRRGGLRVLPPFGMPDSHHGEYNGAIEALSAIYSYIEDIGQEHIILAMGDLAANIDLEAAMERHLAAKAEITAICTEQTPPENHHRFIPDEDGFSSQLLCDRSHDGVGVVSLEVYIITKARLLELISTCSASSKIHLHRDALMSHLQRGGRVNLYMHKGFARRVISSKAYYDISMSMLQYDIRGDLFPPERPIMTKERADVSTYYGEESKSKNSLVADGCYVEGVIENCILFRGVRIERGARLKNCVLMQDTKIGAGAVLAYVIADKDVNISRLTTLAGNAVLPFCIPKGISV